MYERDIMRAARFVQSRRIEIQSTARPQPAPNEVRVRVEGCGVCGSNLGAWRGVPGLEYPLAPGEPGHEAWGRIDQVGSDVRGVRPGERYAFLSSRGFAEYAVADAASLVPLPAGTEIFPGEALGCAFNIHRRCEIRSGHTVALVGMGFIGALLARLAARSGARVIALSQREFSLQLARRMGVLEAISSRDFTAAMRQVMDITQGKGCERVIEAAGTQESLDLASALVSTGGRLIIAGYHQDGARQINLQSWNWRGIDVINAHERDPARYVAGMRAAAAQIEIGALDPSPLYTHGFPLEQCSLAFETLEMRPPGFVKGLIRPGDSGKMH
jgi:threonine dehydrogenase-like Zn-dependent dehydrogenase